MFFLWVIFFIILIIVIFTTLSIKLEIENFELNIPKIEEGFFNTKSKVKLKIYLFRKIKIVSINLKKFRKKKIKYTEIQNVIMKIRKNGNKGNIKIRDMLSDIEINAEKFDLDIDVGLENAATTAIIVGSLYTFIELSIRSKMKTIKEQKCNIKPNYQKDMLYVKFDGIFEINMWNIINIVLRKVFINQLGATLMANSIKEWR